MATTQTSFIDTISITDSVVCDDLVIDLSDINKLNSDVALDWTNLTMAGGGESSTIWASDLSATTTFDNNINLRGDHADITINGVSLKDTLQGIQERLNILTPNPDMEAEWDELHELGQRYRELEKQCIEKSQMWNRLKAMPPPEVS